MDKLKSFILAETARIMPRVIHKNGYTTYSKMCNITRSNYAITVTYAQYKRIRRNDDVKTVLPHLTHIQQAFIIYGTTPDEHNEMIKELN